MAKPLFERRGTRPDRRRPWQSRGAQLLIRNPTPNVGAAEFWKAACFMLAAFALFVGGGIGWSVGYTFNRDAQQAELDSETYRKQAIERDSVADRCTALFDDLAYDATLALHYASYWAEWARAAREYADSLRAEPPVEYVASVEP